MAGDGATTGENTVSIDYSTYVGPYVVCAVNLWGVSRSRRSCPNPTCKNHGAYMPAGFCPTCGTAVSDVRFSEQEFAVDDDDLREQIDERLVTAHGGAYAEWTHTNSAHLWKPNVAWASLRDPHLDRTDFNLQDITADLVQAELAQFESFFAPELAQLRTAYGEAAVSVRWGVIQDYS